ncbi:MAG: voltage-gated chloride channel family protein [Flavobacterium sp.]|nr:voltage-gated chloride channel family protein [Flavobacterium sp.]
MASFLKHHFTTKVVLLLRLSAFIVPLAIVIGLMVAFFLWLLDVVTKLRWQHQWLIWLLPFAGVLIVWLYKTFGKNSDKGNNLIIDAIQNPSSKVTFRMAPLVLFTTIITHLFGGSAGREGTAVQMGGSTADLWCTWLKLNPADKRVLLLCGMSAGFAAVFGTPVTGAVFALEVIAIGSIKFDALLPCLLAGIVADITCAACGIHHTHYTIGIIANHTYHSISGLFFPVDVLLIIKVAIAGCLFGLTAALFANTTHFIKQKSSRYIKQPLLIPVVGGALVIGISYALGTFDYMGLGVTNPNNGVSIVLAFNNGGVTNFSWLWKMLLTAITLGMGFKGGEVTPLFFIGAALGNVLASYIGCPVDLLAGLGFIAVFAGATNTPLACTIMGVELFGGQHVLYYAIACFAAYYCSGHKGIYSSQRVAVNKYNNLPNK